MNEPNEAGRPPGSPQAPGGAANSAAPVQTQVFYQPLAPIGCGEPDKCRRVGTFTLGLSLILLGVAVPLILIFGNTLRFLRFAPVVLVILGVEVLYYAIRYRDGKLRYDGLSIFLVILLTFVSLGASAVLPTVERASHYYREQSQQSFAVEENAREALDAAGLTGDVNCDDYFNHNGWYWHYDETGTDKLYMVLQMNLFDSGGLGATKETAADAFWQVASRLDRSRIYLLRFRLATNVGGDWKKVWYGAVVSGSTLQNLTRESLAARIQTNYYDDGEAGPSPEPAL